MCISQEDAMPRTVQDLMTKNPVTLGPEASAAEAAKLMKEHDIGDVLVIEDDRLCGIVTDRDLAIRCVADGGSVHEPIGEFCSTEPFTLEPNADVKDAVDAMKERAIRRIPVVDGTRLVGVISLGDLAQAQDPRSALGQNSSAPPNQ
jgi:CBS domain-containing protein